MTIIMAKYSNDSQATARVEISEDLSSKTNIVLVTLRDAENQPLSLHLSQEQASELGDMLIDISMCTARTGVKWEEAKIVRPLIEADE